MGITLASECVFEDERRTHSCDFANNQSFVCGAYGDIEKGALRIILRAISNVSAHWHSDADLQSRHSWRRLADDDFKTGHCVDVQSTDERGERIWSIGTIAKVQSDRALIHIPRFGAVWAQQDRYDNRSARRVHQRI